MESLYRAEVKFYNGLSSRVLFMDDDELMALKNAFQWALHEVPKFAQNVQYQHPASVVTSLQVALMQIGRLSDGRSKNQAYIFFDVTMPTSWKESIQKFEATFKETTAIKYTTGHPISRKTMFSVDVKHCNCEKGTPQCVMPDGKVIHVG